MTAFPDPTFTTTTTTTTTSTTSLSPLSGMTGDESEGLETLDASSLHGNNTTSGANGSGLLDMENLTDSYIWSIQPLPEATAVPVVFGIIFIVGLIGNGTLIFTVAVNKVSGCWFDNKSNYVIGCGCCCRSVRYHLHRRADWKRDLDLHCGGQ